MDVIYSINNINNSHATDKKNIDAGAIKNVDLKYFHNQNLKHLTMIK